MKYVIEEESEKVGIIELSMRYIMEAREDIELEDLIQMAREVFVEGGEIIMTIAEKLKMEARKEERYNIALNMLKDNMEIELVAKYTNLEKEKLEFMSEKMKNSNSGQIITEKF